MHIYDTRSRTIKPLTPYHPPTVTFYACGPTVYDYTHIGHARKYTMDDILKRTLTFCGYNVKHVMNITDVGHLTGDDDNGEDKLEKGAKKKGGSVWDIAQFYTDFFHMTMKKMNIIPPNTEPHATKYVQQMIATIQRIEKNGYTYETDEAIYFNISKYTDYGQLCGQKLQEKKQAIRAEIHVDPSKRHPADFALWFKRVGRFKDHVMHWPSPWGEGFPGWHIECSAMAQDTLGEQIDIHSGGVDHIPVHHENEIAQSEAATGKHPFVQFWVHHNFLQVEGQKMSKSLENFYTIEDLEKKGVDPMALRFLFLQTHYRQEMNFTWDALHAVQEAYAKLRHHARELHGEEEVPDSDKDFSEQGKKYKADFIEMISHDLQIPQAVALMWSMVKDKDLKKGEKKELLEKWDAVFGLKLFEIKKEIIPEEIVALAEQRKQAKKERDFATADKLREKIQEQGYVIEDRPEGYLLKHVI